MVPRDVVQLMRHDSGHLAFIASSDNHSAIQIHRPTGKRERVYVARIDNLEVVVKFRMLKLAGIGATKP